MKKLILTLFLVPQLTFAAVEYDLQKGVDFTGITNFSYSLLNQLVDNGKISATNKGAVIRFSGAGGIRWPNVTDNSRYTNFLWLDLNTSPGALKQYVCCGDVYTNWVISTVTPGSITTSEIKDYTILAVDMATNSVPDYAIQAGAISANKIADNGIIAGKLGPVSVTKGTFAFGAITGGDITNKTITYTNIADNTIGPDQLANNAIGTLQLTNGSVTTDKIGLTNVTRNNILQDAIGTVQLTNGAVTTNKLVGEINTSLMETNAAYGVSKCWAQVDSDATINKGLGFSSVVRTATGNYTLTFNVTRVSTNYAALVSVIQSDNSRVYSWVRTNATTHVSVHFTDDAGPTPVNRPFSVIIMDF